MKLFFETSLQAQAFLVTVPIGLLVAFLFDLTSFVHKGRPLVDVLLLLAGGGALLVLVQFMRDDGLRLYHLLALLLGAILYFNGIGRLWRWMAQKIRSGGKKSEPGESPAMQKHA